MKNLLCIFALIASFAIVLNLSVAQPSKNKSKKMKIEVLYFESCPAYKKTIQNLKEIISEEKLTADLVLVNVESEEKAKDVNFQGATSIRVNGKDIEGKNEAPMYGCRIYQIDGDTTATPTKKYLKEKIIALK